MIGEHGTNLALGTDEERFALPQELKNSYTYGSQILFIGWLCYTSVIWSLKGCMLFLFAYVSHPRSITCSAILTYNQALDIWHLASREGGHGHGMDLWTHIHWRYTRHLPCLPAN